MHILIVEDEPALAATIKRFTAEIMINRPVVFEMVHTLEKARHSLLQNKVELLFLDINLNGENGFSLLQDQRARSFYTIIISAYKEKAIDAFDLGVVDFVRKPVTKERLQKAINRYFHSRAHARTIQYLTVRKGNKLLPVAVSNIQYIKAVGHYSEVYLATGTKEFADQSLNDLSRILPSPDFYRLHKSYIARIGAIKHIAAFSGSRYEAKLHSGEKIPVGRTYYKDLKQVLLDSLQ
jgi:two-component system response regulator LytT